MIELVKTWWLDRNESERGAIAFAAILVALLLCYAYAWLPVTRERERLLVRVPELRTEAAALERNARELEKLKSIAKPSPGLLRAVQEAIGASRDPAPEVVQLDSARVRVAIASAPSDAAFTLISRLQS